MIWESGYWQDTLLEQAADLRRRQSQRRWPDRSFARLEQGVMLGFYSVRKLIEAKKLTEAVVAMSIRVSTYPPKGEPVTLLNWHKIDHLYELDKGRKETIGLRALCNSFIHSYVFLPAFSETGLMSGIFVASEWEREQKLLEVPLEKLVWLFELVGNDEAGAGAFVYNPKRRDYDVTLCFPTGRRSMNVRKLQTQEATMPAANPVNRADGNRKQRGSRRSST